MSLWQRPEIQAVPRQVAPDATCYHPERLQPSLKFKAGEEEEAK
jgi:hypothetical protein